MPDTKITVPVVHLNGSGRSALMEQYHRAYMAIQEAIASLQDSMPHGRDYYPLGPDAHHQAYMEQQARIQALRAVQDEIDVIYESLMP